MTVFQVNAAPLPGTLTDPVTGRRAVHFDAAGKPLPQIRRVSAREPDPCPFCLMGQQVAGGAEHVDDGDVTRSVLDSTPVAYTIANRWSVFAAPNACDLVIAHRHVEGLEQLTRDELTVFIDQLTRRQAAHPSDPVAFVNVGADAGGSLKHLHGQVVSSPYPTAVATGAAVDADEDLARRYGLTVAAGDARAWVAAAPTVAGEIRIRAEAATPLSDTLHRVVAHLDAWPYNIVIRRIDDGHLFTQVLPRLDRGIVYPEFFHVTVVGLDVRRWAATLSSDPRQR